MNLSAYMQMNVTQLSEYTPERKHREMPERRKPPKRQSKQTLQEQSEATRNKAIARYKAIVGAGWMKTKDIDRALCRQGGAERIMRRWERLGITEFRPVGGTYHQARGYEWKFCDRTTEISKENQHGITE